MCTSLRHVDLNKQKSNKDFNPGDYHICNKCSTELCPRYDMYMKIYDIYDKTMEDMKQRIAELPDDGCKPFNLVFGSFWVEECPYFTD